MFLKKPNRFFVLILFFILIGFGYLQTVNLLDPDFGWHIKTGELILERGVPRIDWYSYTMPDFPWIDHEWLTDILIYKLHSFFGYQVLLLLFLVMAAFAFTIFIRIENFYIYLVPVLFGFLSILAYLGLRPQIVTMLFVAVLWKVLLDFLDKYDKGFHLFYLIPLLFLIWVNLHGGFAAGIFILGLVLLLEIIKKTNFFVKVICLKIFDGQYYTKLSIRKIIIIFWVLFVSLLATVINPYGVRIYEEVFRSAGDNFLRFHIAEWLPLLFSDISSFAIFYLSLFIGLFFVLRKKIEISRCVVVLLFLALSLISQRHLSILAVLSVPVLSQIIMFFNEKISQERIGSFFSGLGKAAIIFFIFALFFSGFHQNIYKLFSGKNQIDYPEQAVSFLKTLPLSKNLFNEYGWGGYLIWKLPERRLFIDGRMPSWRQHGNFVFGDYIKIGRAEEGFSDLLSRYNIELILLRVASKDSGFKKETTIKNWFAKIVGYRPARGLYGELIDSGWKVIYKDGVAIILER